MDTTIIAGILGVIGTLLGTLLGYILSNSNAKLKAYIDNRLVIYYLRNSFCVYVPVTVINEGSKSGTLSDFKLKLHSNNQIWELKWLCYSEDHTLKGKSWDDIRRASPMLVHGNSGIQCPIKFVEVPYDSSQELSNIIVSAGKSSISFEYYDRDSRKLDSQTYTFELPTHFCEELLKRREDYECNETMIITLNRDAVSA
ncbi:hypothetical protein [Alteromonas sp. CYL-A6]|uniref:hypothetical protein n=1 Tax=Alteromonas nitratireducens TaxID=3390813 RepID=UPI0034A73598